MIYCNFNTWQPSREQSQVISATIFKPAAVKGTCKYHKCKNYLNLFSGSMTSKFFLLLDLEHFIA